MAAAAQYLRVVVNAERRYALWPHARRVPRGWADTYFVGSRLRCLAQITELTRHHAAACPAAPGAAQGRTAIGRLGRVAAGAPYRTAVLGAGFRLTFADLDRRANALARTIAEHGVRRGDLVGLRLRPGADAVVARLAALKAAAAYLPMDDESAVARPGLRLIVTEPEWSGPARRRGLPVLAWTRRDRGAGRVPARADQVEPHDPAFVVPGPAPGGGLVVDHGRLVLAARSAGGPTGCTASGPWRDELAIWGRLLRGEPIRYGAHGVVGQSGVDGPTGLDGKCYVLDEDLRPAVEGQVYFAAAWLGGGYDGGPIRTAWWLRPDPFDRIGGKVMLWTGRRARRDDGVLRLTDV